MIRSTVNVREGFGAEIARQIDAEVRVAVGQASGHGAEVAAGVAQRRRRTGLMADIQPVEVEGTESGWQGGFKSPAFYSGIQSRGTLGSRTRKVKSSTERRRSSASGAARYAKVAASKGVAPLKHEETGLKAARKRLVDLLNRISP